MVLQILQKSIALMAAVALTNAQKTSNVVPEALQAGFTRGTEVQVSYTGEAINGFRDGTTFEKDAVSQEPTFALGDSSGISPTTLYTIIMVDTTCPSALKLHYARANFKNNFDITNIATDSEALQTYKAPGSFSETGDNRQYSFLMYTNPNRREITQLQLPAEGEAFDIAKFQSDNGLPDASAGVGMVVKLGGQADCGEGGEQPNTLPASLPTPRPVASSTATQQQSGVETSAGAGATTAASSNVGASTSGALVSTATGSANATTVTQQSSATASATSSGSLEDGSTPANGTSGGRSAVSTRAPGPSTIVQTVMLSSILPEATGGTPTTSIVPATQTENAAAGLVAGVGNVGMMIVAMGVLFW